MKKKLSAILGFIIIFGSATLGHSTILYLNNFNDGNISAWTHIDSFNGTNCGNWNVIDGILQVSILSCDAQNFKLDTLILPDSYIIEFDTRTIIEGASSSLIGFYTHWSNWSYWVGHGYRPGRFYIQEYQSSSYEVYEFAEANGYLWHHFKYIKNADSSSLYYDGQIVYENLYFPISLSGGNFVLAGGRWGIHQFDNLVIRTLELSIEDILILFDSWVDSGTLIGSGPGNSANNRLNALRNMLEMAGDLISADDIEGGCRQLSIAYDKCDGDLSPPDFVVGDALSTLSESILDLMENLGCE